MRKILIFLVLCALSYAQHTITPEDWNKAYRPTYWAASDSTIIKVKYSVVTDLIAFAESIECTKVFKRRGDWYFIKTNGETVIKSTGGMYFDVSVQEAPQEK